MDTRTMVVSIVAAVLVAAVLFSPIACTMRRQQLVADAIAKGADPISAKCAIEGDSDNRTSAMCLVKALEKK